MNTKRLLLVLLVPF